jgi:hypothetical protein
MRSSVDLADVDSKGEKQESPAQGRAFRENACGLQRAELPSDVGFRSARARSHARGHTGAGQDIGVGVSSQHRAAMLAQAPQSGKPAGHETFD